jgi:hypothetical protein
MLLITCCGHELRTVPQSARGRFLTETLVAVAGASDSRELYVGGTMADIAVYDTETFEQLGRIEMPDGADQVLSSPRLIQR